VLRKIHIYDVDGVLVNSNHRYPSRMNHTPSELEYWNNPEARKNTAQDTLLPMAYKYINDIGNPEIYVVIATARMWDIRDRLFFEKNLGMPDKIICRVNWKPITDAKLKVNGLKRLFNLKQFANLEKNYWDDNMRNIYAVADLGVHCFYIQG